MVGGWPYPYPELFVLVLMVIVGVLLSRRRAAGQHSSAEAVGANAVLQQARPKRDHNPAAIGALLGGVAVAVGTQLPWWRRMDGVRVSTGEVFSLSRELQGGSDLLSAADTSTFISWFLALLVVSVLIALSLVITRRKAILRRALLSLAGVAAFALALYLYKLPDMLRDYVPEGQPTWQRFLHQLGVDVETALFGELRADIGVFVMGAGGLAVAVSALIKSREIPGPTRLVDLRTPPRDGLVTELERLSQLRDTAAISEDEFMFAKARLLDAGSVTRISNERVSDEAWNLGE